MCSEKDPIGCHCMILVCRHLRDADRAIAHILEDGELEDNKDAERRLMRELDIAENHLFATREELVEEAYEIQGGKTGSGMDPLPAPHAEVEAGLAGLLSFLQRRDAGARVGEWPSFGRGPGRVVRGR